MIHRNESDLNHPAGVGLMRWQVRADVWRLLLKPFDRRLARLEPTPDGLYFLVIGERPRAGPYTKGRAFELGMAHARNRLEIERFCRQHGDKQVAELQGHHVRKLMDAFGARTGAANQLRKVLRVMMQHAVAIGLRRDDPTRDVKAASRKSKSHHPWTDQEIAQFESRWPVGTRERLAFALLIHTGQRSGDVRRIGPQHVQGNAIRVVQEKTGIELLIPISARLQEAIDCTRVGHLAYITTNAGTIFPPTSCYQWFKRACCDAGLPHCSPHGLRHAASRKMAEAGVNALGIASVTGHRSLNEVTRYTRSADQRRLAAQAIAAVEQNESKKVSNLDTETVQPTIKHL